MLLSLHNLQVVINNKSILQNITFDLAEGESLSVLWHNGSGKTTLLKAIMWLVPASGEIIFEWKNIVNEEVFQRARLGIGYIMQEVPEYTWIKVFDYVKNILDLENKFDESQIAYYFDLFWLDWGKYKNRNFDSHLSGWEKKKIEIITTFLMDKKLYLLDEIESSLDVTSRLILADIIKQFQKQWKSFIIVSHNEEIIKLASKGVLLCNWSIQALWELEKLLNIYLNKCENCESKGGCDFS